MPRKITLTIEQESRFRELWESGTAVSRIAAEFHLTHDTVNRLRIRLELRPRTAKTRAAPRGPYRDPTADEIAERIRQVQADWTPEIEVRRRVIQPGGPVEAVFYPDDVFEFDE